MGEVHSNAGSDTKTEGDGGTLLSTTALEHNSRIVLNATASAECTPTGYNIVVPFWLYFRVQRTKSFPVTFMVVIAFDRLLCILDVLQTFAIALSRFG